MYSFRYNQQDATFYNILDYCHGGSKQAWHVPDAVCTVFELLMMGGETALNMKSTDKN
jgi:hypothetical protein